jgi:cytochrome c peroxidase
MEKEVFSNFEYNKIRTPPNRLVRAENGRKPGNVDRGLLANPAVTDKAHDGKFKVPTLRNVAVTAPYMHNGVFKDLRTTVLFYNKYNSKSSKRQINPETNAQWDAPEIGANLSLKELESGPALDDRRIDALVAFLKTLTDKRYEHLLSEQARSDGIRYLVLATSKHAAAPPKLTTEQPRCPKTNRETL